MSGNVGLNLVKNKKDSWMVRRKHGAFILKILSFFHFFSFCLLINKQLIKESEPGYEFTFFPMVYYYFLYSIYNTRSWCKQVNK